MFSDVTTTDARPGPDGPLTPADLRAAHAGLRLKRESAFSLMNVPQELVACGIYAQFITSFFGITTGELSFELDASKHGNSLKANNFSKFLFERFDLDPNGFEEFREAVCQSLVPLGLNLRTYKAYLEAHVITDQLALLAAHAQDDRTHGLMNVDKDLCRFNRGQLLSRHRQIFKNGGFWEVAKDIRFLATAVLQTLAGRAFDTRMTNEPRVMRAMQEATLVVNHNHPSLTDDSRKLVLQANDNAVQTEVGYLGVVMLKGIEDAVITCVEDYRTVGRNGRHHIAAFAASALDLFSKARDRSGTRVPYQGGDFIVPHTSAYVLCESTHGQFYGMRKSPLQETVRTESKERPPEVYTGCSALLAQAPDGRNGVAFVHDWLVDITADFLFPWCNKSV